MSRRGAAYCPIGLLLGVAMAWLYRDGLLRGCAQRGDELLEDGAAPGDAILAVQEPGVVVQGEHEPVHREHELVRVGLGREVTLFDRLLHRADELALPRADHADQEVSDRPRTVVVLDRTR